jgi:hypothetical protein
LLTHCSDSVGIDQATGKARPIGERSSVPEFSEQGLAFSLRQEGRRSFSWTARPIFHDIDVVNLLADLETYLGSTTLQSIAVNLWYRDSYFVLIPQEDQNATGCEYGIFFEMTIRQL